MTSYEPQHIVSPEGVPMVVITRAEFDRLRALSGDEDARDVAAARHALAESEVRFPAAVVDHILNGATPLAAWRAYRGLTQNALGAQAGLSQSAIARLERPGTTGVGLLATRRALARALGVPVGALDPIED